MIKAIIFDAFGVIYPEWGNVFRDTAPVENREAIQEIFDLGDLGKLNDEEYVNRVSDLMQMTRDELQEVRFDKCQPDLQVLELAKEFRSTYKTAMLSNSSLGYIPKLMKRDNLDEYFEEFILSSEHGVMKPDKRIYEIAIEKLEIEPKESVFIDDRQVNIDAAKAVGMYGVLFESVAQVKVEVTQLAGSKASI